MNMTSLLKKGMKNAKEKIKINASSDGVIVEGKKCRTAEALVKAVKKVAKKDKAQEKTYGQTWNELATAYRRVILSVSFKRDKNSEEFYEAFIEKFKNKTVVPTKLDEFYNKYKDDLDSEIQTDNIALVYTALSFYAMREKSLSHSLSKCKPIEYADTVFENPRHLLEKTKQEFKSLFEMILQKQTKISKLLENAKNAAKSAYKSVYDRYYGSGTDMGEKLQEMMLAIGNLGSMSSPMYRNFYVGGVLKKSITKDNISKENAMFYNFRKHPEQFEIALTEGSTKSDPKIVDMSTVTYDCLNLWSYKRELIDTINGYLYAAKGEIDKAKDLLHDKEALDAAEILCSVIKELNEIASCKNAFLADKVARSHGRKPLYRNRQTVSANNPLELGNEKKKDRRTRRKSI